MQSLSLSDLTPVPALPCLASPPDRRQRRPLLRRQTPRLAARQISELHGPKLHAHKTFDDKSQRRAQASDFAFASLGDRHLELPPVTTQSPCRHPLGFHETILQHHALSRLEDGFLSLSGDGRDVRSLDL